MAKSVISFCYIVRTNQVIHFTNRSRIEGVSMKYSENKTIILSAKQDKIFHSS